MPQQEGICIYKCVSCNNGGPLQQTAGAGGQGGKGRCTWT